MSSVMPLSSLSGEVGLKLMSLVWPLSSTALSSMVLMGRVPETFSHSKYSSCLLLTLLQVSKVPLSHFFLSLYHTQVFFLLLLFFSTHLMCILFFSFFSSFCRSCIFVGLPRRTYYTHCLHVPCIMLHTRIFLFHINTTCIYEVVIFLLFLMSKH